MQINPILAIIINTEEIMARIVGELSPGSLG
jgi:hypothetical protein